MKNKICIIVFSAFLLVFGAVCLIKEPVDVLVSERRKAAEFPTFSAKTVADKTFFNGLEDYLADNFPLRDKFREIKAVIQMKVFAQKDNGGVYLANGHISQLDSVLNESSVKKTAEKINFIKEKYLDEKNNKIYAAIIPDKNRYLAAENGYPSLDYEKTVEIFKENLDSVEYIDIFDCLDADCYYKTDTHWRQEKLDGVVERLGEKMNFSSQSNYTRTELSEFEGVYASRLAFGYEADKIIVLSNESTDLACVNNIEKGEKSVGVYNKAKLGGYDKYDVFLSGATALMTVQNPLAEKERKLILFRDSFASSLAPLLLSEYSQITLVDIRYISSDILGDYVDFENSDVLFIYNTQILNQSSILK